MKIATFHQLKFKLNWLIMILILGGFLRIYNLQTTPAALNRDEASIGYTAFSLLKTGKDEYQKTWPINYQSFGDWKLIGYPMIDIPFVAIFGLSEFSVRLPSLLAGLGLIILVFFLTKNWQEKYQHHQSLPYISALLIAISPWSVHFSRFAYEANLALLFFSLAIICFILTVKRSHRFLSFSALFFSLTMITYHAYQLVTPLMILGLILIYHTALRKIFKSHKLSIAVAIATLAIFLGLLFFGGAASGNETKFSGLSVFSQDLYKEQMFIDRNLLAEQNPMVGRVYVNRPVLIAQRLASNVFQAISSDFLFFNGGGHGSHDTTGLGKIFLFQAPLLIIGLISLFSKKSLLINKEGKLILIVWVIIGLLPGIITLVPAHSTRLSSLQVPLAIISAIGMVQLMYWLKTFSNKTKIIAVFIFIMLISLETYRAFVTYYLIAPKRDIDNGHWYAKTMVTKLTKLKSQYKNIYISGKTWSPYIYMLFYQSVNPRSLASDLTYDPVDLEGFRYANQWQNISFGSISWDKLEKESGQALVVIKKNELPADKQNLLVTNLVDTIDNQWSNVIWYLLKF